MANNLASANIEKLNRENYWTWAADLKFLLIEKNCWDIVNGKEIKPDKEKNELLENFNRRCRTAISTIYLNVEAEFRRIIEDLEDPEKAWLKLKENFEPDCRYHHMRLFTEMLSTRIQPGESINSYASRLVRLSHQLKGLNEPFPENYLCFQLLRYLPQEFDPIVQQILRWDKNFNFNSILTELIAEESRLKMREDDRIHERFAFSSKVKKNNFRASKRCYRCNQMGHLQRNYRVQDSRKSSSPLRHDSESASSSNHLNRLSPVQPSLNQHSSDFFDTRSRSRARNHRHLAPVTSQRKYLSPSPSTSSRSTSRTKFQNNENNYKSKSQMNPLLTVPTIDDNGFYLYESRAVLTYMLNKYAPDSSVYPKEPQERAAVDRMLYFDLGTIYKTQADALLPKALRGEEVDPEKFTAYQKALQLFDDMLGKSDYAAGTHITLADFSILATITTAQIADVTFEKYPNITAWMNKVKVEIPSYKEINEIPVQNYKEELKSRNKK